jgi:hypothetical protein
VWLGELRPFCSGFHLNLTISQFVLESGSGLTNSALQILVATMERAERPTCSHCGANLILALLPDGKGERAFQCLDCERPNTMLASCMRDVSRSEDTDQPGRQVDLTKAANPVPFLVTDSELRERKFRRRKNRNGKWPSLNPPLGR